MNLAITGASGFIGSNFAEYCISRDLFKKIICLDRVNITDVWWFTESEKMSFGEFYKADLKEIRNYLTDLFFNVDYILHLAAITSVDTSIADPQGVYQNNIKCMQSVLELCRKYPNLKLIFVSSDEVYGEVMQPNQVGEIDPLKPGNPYAASKASCEMLCLSYERTYSIPISILRLGNVYGPRQHPIKMIPRAIGCALGHYEFPMYGDGSNVRSWLYIDDACEAISKAIMMFMPRSLFNITSHESHSNIEVLQVIEGKLGRDRLKIRRSRDRQGHDRGYSVISDKFRALTGWRPSTPLDLGLEYTINWYMDRSKSLISETVLTLKRRPQ